MRCFVAKITTITVIFLLAITTIVAARADVGSMSVEQLKQATTAGDGIAAAALVTQLLSSVSTKPTAEPDAQLFAAQCWWQHSRNTILDATAAGDVEQKHFNYLDTIWQNYSEAMMLTPGQLKTGESEYAFLDTNRQQAELERWGPGIEDKFNIRHKSITETMPELMAIQITSFEDIDKAISSAEAISVDHPQRPEPCAYVAQMYLAKGNLAAAKEHANTALRHFPGYYLGHQILARIELEQLGQAYTCDSAIAWQRLLQADNYNIQSALLLQPLIEMYQMKPELQRAIDIQEQLKRRVGHDEMVIEMEKKGQSLGERVWFTEEQRDGFRRWIEQVDALIATSQ